jgi:beta-mannosidase
VILDYVSRRYCFPKSEDALIYLSQLNQAYCMQVGVEHYRRLQPRCMGALYWQINDCWPVASWSSIEFTGRWKALHYVARRFFAPLLVSAHVPGDETVGNYRKTTVSEVHLYTVSDDPRSRRGELQWQLCHVDGRRLKAGKKRLELKYGESVLQQTLNLAAVMERHGRENLYVRISLNVAGERVSEDTVLLTPPRFLNLPRGPVKVKIVDAGAGAVDLEFQSAVWQHRFWFDLPELTFRATDNCFDLYPNEPKRVRLTGDRKLTKTKVQNALEWMSLADTYE